MGPQNNGIILNSNIANPVSSCVERLVETLLREVSKKDLEFSDQYTFIITRVVKSAGQYGNFLGIDRISSTNKIIKTDKVGHVRIC